MSPATAQCSGCTPIPITCGIQIQTPGTYVLTDDTHCWPTPVAVEILSSDVDLNLQGFTLTGSIKVSNVSRVRIHDGVVSAWSAYSISFDNVQDSHLTGIQLYAIDGTGCGISGGGNNLIRDSVMRGMVGLGIGQSVGNTVLRSSIFGDVGLWLSETRDTQIVSNTIGGDPMAAAYIDGTGDSFEDNSVYGVGGRVGGNGNSICGNSFFPDPARGGFGVSGNANRIVSNTVRPYPVEMGGSGTYPLGMFVGGSGNFIQSNTAIGAAPGAFDLSGPADTCTANKWRNNTFETASPECIR